MNERYTKLYNTPQNLYINGAPVVIIAGALLKDNESGRVLGQLKFKNIDVAAIIALTVQITTFDSAGRTFPNKKYVLQDVENTCVTALEVSKEWQNIFAENGYPEMECCINVGIYSIGVGTSYIYQVSNGVESNSYFDLSDLQEYHN